MNKGSRAGKAREGMVREAHLGNIERSALGNRVQFLVPGVALPPPTAHLPPDFFSKAFWNPYSFPYGQSYVYDAEDVVVVSQMASPA